MARRAKRLVRPVIKEVSGVDHPAHLSGGWIVMKAAGDPDPEVAEIQAALDDPDYDDDDAYYDDEGADDVPDAVLARQVADLRTELATAKAARAALEEAVTKAGGTVPVPDPAVVAAAVAEAQEEEEFAKAVEGLPDATRVYLEGQRAEVRKARDEARIEREARLSQEYLDVAKGRDFGHVPAAPESLATTLRTLDDRLPPETAAEVKRILKAAGAQAQFAEIGGHGQPAPTGPLGEVAQVVDEIRKADPTLSKAAAFVKARDEHPELASKFSAEMQDRS